MTIYNLKLRKQMTEDAIAQATSLGHALSPFYRQETYPRETHCVSAPEHRLLAVCERCGCPLELPRGDRQALYLSCEPDADAAAEGQALLVGEVPQLLYNRLTEAAEALPNDIALFFDPGELDTSRRCLLSNDGIWRLQFSGRRNPDAPISPDNLQSPKGRVEFYRNRSENQLLPVTYVGPEIDPNISSEEKRRRVKVLFSGEEGLAYCMEEWGEGYGEDRWRFRRLDGTRAYIVQARFLQFHKRQGPLTQAIEERVRALQASGGNEVTRGGRNVPLFVHEPLPVLTESA